MVAFILSVAFMALVVIGVLYVLIFVAKVGLWTLVFVAAVIVAILALYRSSRNQ